LKLLKTLASLVVTGIAVYLLYIFCWIPVICSHVTRTTIAATNAAVDAQPYRKAIYARRNLKSMQKCTGACTPIPPDVAMIKGANLRMLGRTDEAIALYNGALRYGPRPEIYFNLGHAYAESGNREAAFQSLFRAAAFAPTMIASFDDGDLQVRVRRAVDAREKQLRRRSVTK